MAFSRSEHLFFLNAQCKYTVPGGNASLGGFARPATAGHGTSRRESGDAVTESRIHKLGVEYPTPALEKDIFSNTIEEH